MEESHRQLTIADFVEGEVLDLVDIHGYIHGSIVKSETVVKSEDLKAVLRDNPTSYLNKSFDIDFNGQHMFVKCIDIEFEGGLGPLFLMENHYGNKFWLTRKEMEL